VAGGGTPAELPYVAKNTPADWQATPPRDVYIYFISAAKERNPAAAMALQARLQA